MNKPTLGDAWRGTIGYIFGAKSFWTYRHSHLDAGPADLVFEAVFALALAILATAVLDLACRYRRRYPNV
jgi:UDP-N-acetylenolpyruvoylglucosamine reductase